jgi:hypothetical protein
MAEGSKNKTTDGRKNLRRIEGMMRGCERSLGDTVYCSTSRILRNEGGSYMGVRLADCHESTVPCY